jgi:hypothetical protein
MEISDTGVAIDEVVGAVKNAIKVAGISVINDDRDLQVTSIQLLLNTVATSILGGGVDFRVPFLGMKLSIGRKVTRSDTHMIDIALQPLRPDGQHEIRDGPVEGVLVEAINTIRKVMMRAVEGDDPFLLESGLVELSFAVTEDGTITLGFMGEFKEEITHTLRMALAISKREVFRRATNPLDVRAARSRPAKQASDIALPG